ncbi:MAG: hypothetical protein SGCHY_001059 [Lobulomycetales sp.]
MRIEVRAERLTLLSLPKTSLKYVMHPVVKVCPLSFPVDAQNLLRADGSFFSLTENSIEISIITSAPEDFPESGSSTCPGIRYLDGAFRALQIDSTGSSTIISDITDYLFVKETRLEQVASTLCGFGYEIQMFDTAPSQGEQGEAETGDRPMGSYDTPESVLLDFVRGVPKTVDDRDLRLVGLDRDILVQAPLLLIRFIFYPKDMDADRFYSYTFSSDGVSLLAQEEFLTRFPAHLLHQSQDHEALVRVEVDLRSLDRFGIVWGMSRLIQMENLALFYLSTVQTANILVLQHERTRVEELLDTRILKMNDTATGAVAREDQGGRAFGHSDLENEEDSY